MARNFSKNPQPRSKSGKTVMAAILAVVLGVLVIRHFARTQLVVASEAQGAALALGAPSSSTADELRDLANDPTKPWLRGEAEPKSQLDNAPHDPFQMSTTWRTKLTKPEPVRSTVAQSVETRIDPRPQAPIFDPSALKLQGIFKDNRRTYALINGNIVTENNVVGGARIVDILEDRIVCQPLGAPETVRIEIALKRGR